MMDMLRNIYARIGPALHPPLGFLCVYLGTWLATTNSPPGWATMEIQSLGAIPVIFLATWLACSWYSWEVRPKRQAALAPIMATAAAFGSMMLHDSGFKPWVAISAMILFIAGHWETMNHRYKAVVARNPRETLARGKNRIAEMKFEAAKRFFATQISANNGLPVNLIRNVYVEYEHAPKYNTGNNLPDDIEG